MQTGRLSVDQFFEMIDVQFKACAKLTGKPEDSVTFGEFRAYYATLMHFVSKQAADTTEEFDPNRSITEQMAERDG